MDSSFFIASKIIWALIRPDTLLLLLTGFALIAFWRNAKSWGIMALATALCASLVIAIFPIGDLVLRPLETRFPINPALENVDGILILGGAEHATRTRYWKQPQLSSSAERLVEGVALANRFPEARLVYTGGSGSILNQSDTGASVAEGVFLSLGIKKARIQIEQQSRNTVENARRTFDLIKPGNDEQWVLITSASHMPRAIGVFCRIGWPLIAYPVDYRSGAFVQEIGWSFASNLDDLNTGAKEWVGLLAYWITGKTNSFLTDSC